MGFIEVTAFFFYNAGDEFWGFAGQGAGAVSEAKTKFSKTLFLKTLVGGESRSRGRPGFCAAKMAPY